MSNISIKDYLNLKEIREFLIIQLDAEIDKSDGYSNNITQNYNRMVSNLANIIEKLEKE